jgi:GAF domain-containing protein
MKKRSKAASKPAKALPRKPLKRKGRSAAKALSHRGAAPAREKEVARLTRELVEAREQQTATSEVLQVISSSPGDLQPVFATMLKEAVRICDAGFGNIYRWDGQELHLVAAHNTPSAFAEIRAHMPLQPGRMVATKSVVHVSDLKAERSYLDRVPASVAAVELGGVRTFLSGPMVKEGELIGAIMLNRTEVRPFSKERIALVTNFAAQAVIAIENARLLNELRQRTSDLTEALEQQTATSEVLQVISSSPGDVQPVFASMLEKVVRIGEAAFGTIYRWEGEAGHLVATYNLPQAFEQERRNSPDWRPAPESPVARLLITKSVVHVTDLASEEVYIKKLDTLHIAAVEGGRVRTVLFVPMLKQTELMGFFGIARQEVRPFTNKQIELKTSPSVAK